MRREGGRLLASLSRKSKKGTVGCLKQAAWQCGSRWMVDIPKKSATL